MAARAFWRGPSGLRANAAGRRNALAQGQVGIRVKSRSESRRDYRHSPAFPTPGGCQSSHPCAGGALDPRASVERSSPLGGIEPCRTFRRPVQDAVSLPLTPGVETPGYYQRSLRDLSSQRGLLPSRHNTSPSLRIPSRICASPIREYPSMTPVRRDFFQQ